MPYRKCPRFETCACNACPLDPDSSLRGGQRFALPGEEACRATRATREQIAVDNGLDPALVLLPRERRRDLARQRWEELAADVRELVLAGGSATRFKGPTAPKRPVYSHEPGAAGEE